MNAGFTITKQGWHLLAKLVAGATLEISKVMVGGGKVPEGANPGELTALVQPVALATSTVPQVADKQVSFIVEYRSDLNGGLAEGFWLNEFGVFANDPDEGEVLLYYATMGDYPQYVSAFSGGSVDIRRYPVSIALSDCEEVQLAYPAGALVTAEEMAAAFAERGVPPGGLEGQALVKAGAGSNSLTKWGPYPSNQNLLINSDFRKPVNRNGKSEYTAAGYTIDGWIISGILKVKDGYIEVVTPNTIMRQYLKENSLGVKDKVTLSCLCINNVLLVVTGEVPTSGIFAYQKISNAAIYGYVDNDGISYIISNDATDTPTGVIAAKLEFGDQQTLAHQDADGNWVLNDPPDYDLQYALCSQYSPITGEFVGSQHSNPNLLDNAYWANIYNVINQRGQLEYTSGYGIDRWTGRTTRILENDGLKIVSNVQYDSTWQYILLSDLLLDRNYTLSLLTYDNELLVGSGVISSNASSFTSFITTNTLNGIKMSCVLDSDTSRVFVSLLQPSGTTKKYKAAKLELGPVQTLAHKEGDNWVLNDPPPNFATELYKCQRYFERLYIPLGFTLDCVKENILKANIFYQPKRTIPTITTPPLYVVRHSDNDGVYGSGIRKTPLFHITENSAVMQFSDNQIKTVPVGESAYISSNNYNSYIDISAEP